MDSNIDRSEFLSQVKRTPVESKEKSGYTYVMGQPRVLTLGVNATEFARQDNGDFKALPQDGSAHKGQAYVFASGMNPPFRTAIESTVECGEAFTFVAQPIIRVDPNLTDNDWDPLTEPVYWKVDNKAFLL